VNNKNSLSHDFVRGYVEGYYGKLLTWTERYELVQHLSSLNLNTYCYAPKEDPQHRFSWRESHSSQWHDGFSQLCTTACDASVSIIAGIAPGLDFHFTPQGTSDDFTRLRTKAQQYLDNGATDIMVLWDDIDDKFVAEIEISEGTAHARVVNELADTLGRALWTVPRVYADEIENNNQYLEDFFAELQAQHTVLICGNAIVASRVQKTDLTRLSRTSIKQNNDIKYSDLKHRTVVWDNFYANDYCPRRLFVGPWSGREEIKDYLINPTGLQYTDRLILDIATSTHTTDNPHTAWIDALKRHDVPDAFLSIAPYFKNPCFGDRITQPDSESIAPKADVEQAIEECLWKWKSPLAREWYPFIMSLKHDLAMMQKQLPTDRILKTQTPCLANRLLD